jgi:hypothetical protein
LVGGAAMPSREVLPADLQGLTDWQNHEIPSRLWNESCDRLAASLRQLLTGPQSEPMRVQPRWPRLALVGTALVILALGGTILNKRLHPTPQGQGVSLPISAPGLPKGPGPDVPPQPARVVPDFQVAGSWVLVEPRGKAGFNSTVTQAGSVVEIQWPGDPGKQGLFRADLKPEENFARGTAIENGLRILAEIHTMPSSLEWRGTMTAQRGNNAEEEVGTGQGSFSSDWRHWKGTFTPKQGRNETLSISLDLNKADTEWIWTAGSPADQRVIIFRRK